MRNALCLLVALALSGCVQPAPEGAVSVDEVRTNILAWDGREVWVVGWLGECWGNNCGLHSSRRDARTVADARWDTDEWKQAMDRRLGVGHDDDFDADAKWMQFQKVAIRATINSACSEAPYGCMDRADDLVPLEIVRVF